MDEETGRRRSALAESASLMATLVAEDVRTIGFIRSRRAAELFAEFTRREVGDAARLPQGTARGTSRKTAARSNGAGQGELLGVASTSALELGIDIGALDAVVLTGYPGTRASMWQQAGRAGRRAENSLAMLVAQDDPLDQYLVHHPEDLFDKPAEAAESTLRTRTSWSRTCAAPRASSRSPMTTTRSSARARRQPSRGWVNGGSSRAAATPGTTPDEKSAAPAGGRPGRRRLRQQRP